MTIQEKSRKYYEKNKEKLKEKQRNFYKNNKEKIKESKKGYKQKRNPVNTRKTALKSRYKITPEEYSELLLSQNSCCAICGRHQSEFKKNLHVDYNHSTGEIRGLLCFTCNNGIGSLKDSIDLLTIAVDYLKKYT